MLKNRTTFAHLCGLFSGIVWGVTFISSKILLRSFASTELLFYRFIIAFIALSLLKPKLFRWQGVKREFHFMLAGLTGITLYQYCENAALNRTYASNVSVIVGTAPLLTALFVFLYSRGKEKLRLNFFIGFLVAMTGISLIAFNGTRLKLSPVGDLLALGCAIIWGFYSVNGNIVAEYKENVLLVTRRSFMYGIIFLIPLMLREGFELGLERFRDPVNMGNLIFLGVIASGICFVTWNYSIGVLGSVKTTVYVYISPVVTVIVSAIVLKEKITLLSLTGTILTLLGLVITNLKSDGRKPEHKINEE